MSQLNSGFTTSRQEKQESGFREYDRKLIKQFIYGVDDKSMKSDFLRGVSLLEGIDDSTTAW